MLELAIESIIKPMKTNGKTTIVGTMDNQPIRIDLNNLVIHYHNQDLLLETIPGTYGGKRYFFLCPDCERRCRKLFKASHTFACGSCQKVHQATLNRSKTDCCYY
ncbi:phage protein [Streptococcus dysgalactiae]|nr:phage protein [Streptococcus dysgalactiae subsp. dysgalactiae]SUN48563.1 phage protein [Streptococcus dysgalactiae]SUN54576.1 phage protein [Streptococcus dysgalactiae]